MTDRRTVRAAILSAALAVAAAAGTVVGPVAAAPADEATVIDDTATITIGAPEAWTFETAPAAFAGSWHVPPATGPFPTVRGALGESNVIAQAFPLSDHGAVTESFYGDYGAACDITITDWEQSTTGGQLEGSALTSDCHGQSRVTIVGDVAGNYTVVVDAFVSNWAHWETMLEGLDFAASIAATKPPAQFDFGSFADMPQLGEEPVRGSGCGSNGQLGATIPDGWWATYLPSGIDVSAEWVHLDIACVFFGETAQQVVTEGTATIVNRDPDFLVVNNSPRARSMPIDPAATVFEGARDSEQRCQPAEIVTAVPSLPVRLAWVEIVDGSIRTAFVNCYEVDPEFEPADPGEINAPPPLPSTERSVWPYGQFWNVPQLGREPTRGSGCGASGQLGDTIPDGLWAGYISYDPAADEFWVDVLCIFAGDTAAAVKASGNANIISDEPDYLVINNNDQRRRVPNNAQTVGEGVVDDDGECFVAQWTYGPDDGHMTGQLGEAMVPDAQAWIRVHEGAVTWIVYGCDRSAPAAPAG